MKSALSRFPDANRILVGVENDACAIGALTALKDEGKTGEAVIVGQGMQETLRKVMMKSDTPIKAGVAYFPERYGDVSMQVVLDLIESRDVTDAVYVDAALLMKDNILEYYPQ
jgi:ribose transport system substrate-binding protein